MELKQALEDLKRISDVIFLKQKEEQRISSYPAHHLAEAYDHTNRAIAALMKAITGPPETSE
jgi:hypothetical protein